MSLTGTNLLSALLNRHSSPQSKRPFAAHRVASRVLALAFFWTAASGFAQNYTFSTFAGVSGTPGSANGTGSSNGKPLFHNPGGIVVDKNGNAFVADTVNNSIRMVTAAGVVTTFAGIGGLDGNTDGTGIAARFSAPQGAAIASDGTTIYVADYGSSTIRKITPSSDGKSGVVTTVAGEAYSNGYVDGTGTAARFNRPIAVAVDKSGILYVADSANNQIRKITAAGVVSSLAGSPSLFYGSSDSTDGKGSSALFHKPHGIVVDGSGSVYVADTGNNTIRKITSAGVVTTIAGKAEAYGSTDATGTAARFDFPSSMVINAAGDILYIADEANHTIRKMDLKTAAVTTIAGVAGTTGFDDDTFDQTGTRLTKGKLNHPTGLALSSDEKTLFVTDYTNHLVRTLALASGNLTTLAGVAGVAGSAEGTGYSSITASLLYNPSATAVDSSHNVYVADTNNQTIRKFSSAGSATTLAGGVQLVGAVDAKGTAARFNNPSGIAVSRDTTGIYTGTVYVADTSSHTIRKIASDGTVTTLAGAAGFSGESMITTTSYAADPITPTTLVTTVKRVITTVNPTTVTTTTTVSTLNSGVIDGVIPATTVVNSWLFNLPSSVAVDKDENVYVADYNNHNIRKITPAGVVSVFAGTGTPGSVTSSSFNHPRALAIDSTNTYLYVADLGNQAIRRVALVGGAISLYAGTGATGSADGAATAATFNGPSAIAIDLSGVLFVTDSNNHTIRAISTSGVVSTIAGSAPNPGYADGIGSAVRFNQPMGIAVDGSTLYVADYRNNTIRMGVPTSSGPGNTPPTDSGTATTGNNKISLPVGIAPDLTSGGFLFVADTANNCIKKIASDGSVTIYAGKSQVAGKDDGIGTAATFNGPSGLINDGSTSLYVADRNNALIRKINLATAEVTTIAGSRSGAQGNTDGVGTAATFQSPVALTIDSLGNLYVADASAHTIRKINLSAIAATVAVAATPGSAATGSTAAVLATPAKAAVPAITQYTVVTVAGSALTAGEADGAGSAARFNSPHGISTDSSGVLYVADTNNNTIRLISTVDVLKYADDGYSIASTVPAYTVSTLAGTPGISGAYDGLGNLALFSRPTGIIANGASLYVADTGNSLIRSVSGGAVRTIAGIAGIAGYRDGTNTTALFNHPEAITANGAVYLADTGNSSIRILSGSSVLGLSLKDPSTPTTTVTNTTSAAVSSSGGGAMNSWFVGALALLLFASGKTRRRSA